MASSFQWRAPASLHGRAASQISLGLSGGNGRVLMKGGDYRSPLLKTGVALTPHLLQFQEAPRNCVTIRAVAETLQQQGRRDLDRVAPAGELCVVLEAARTKDKLRAAATLRARSFYSYPEGRCIDAVTIHQNMKADEEWATLTRKVGGLEPGYKRTTCVIACCPFSDVVDTGSDLHSHCKVSSSPAEDCVVVGTLDINQGLVLPGELTGDHPQGPDAEHSRAYLSNVCVAQEVRRRGVGLLLMQHVKKLTKQWGVSNLYVHVVVDNISARQLYEKAGFFYEKEESVKEARSICRPRRFLLRAQL